IGDDVEQLRLKFLVPAREAQTSLEGRFGIVGLVGRKMRLTQHVVTEWMLGVLLNGLAISGNRSREIARRIGRIALEDFDHEGADSLHTGRVDGLSLRSALLRWLLRCGKASQRDAALLRGRRRREQKRQGRKRNREPAFAHGSLRARRDGNTIRRESARASARRGMRGYAGMAKLRRVAGR